MRSRVRGVFAALLLCAATAAAEPDPLESRVERLERSSAEPEKKPEPGEIGFWFDRGLRMESRDGGFTGRIGAYVITQSAAYPRLRESDKPDSFAIKETGIEIGARFAGSFEVFISPDFRTAGSRL
ncbi:MAG: hypothetical protein K8T20_20160 [Planctomycetes bacterium]|nr:hypothetical protein [Planctomycetota bacterium]